MSDSDIQTQPQPAAPVVSRADTIQQIAQILIKRRKERDLTLEKVSQVIKIRLPYLQAIESGKWEELPGEVYVRGFVKRYGDFMGLDPAALLAPYLSSSAPAAPTPPVNTPATSEINRLQFLWIGLIGIFLVVFIKVIQKERTAPLKSVAPVTASTAAATTSPVIAPVAVVPAQSRSTLPKHSLQIFSPNSLWLRVTASDKTFEGFIPTASSWTWRGQGVFTVRFGHTKQVVLSFDGEPVPLGDDQKSITLPVPHEN